MSCVYFIKAKTEPPIYKIGKTKGSVRKRIQSLQTGCPYVLEYYAKIKTLNIKKTERDIHKQLSAYRMHGEWFKVTIEQVNQVLAEYGIDTTPNFDEITFDNGHRCLVRLADNEIFIPINVFSKLQQTVYLFTAPTTHFEDDVPFVNLREIEKDYPEMMSDFVEFRAKINSRCQPL